MNYNHSVIIINNNNIILFPLKYLSICFVPQLASLRYLTPNIESKSCVGLVDGNRPGFCRHFLFTAVLHN